MRLKFIENSVEFLSSPKVLSVMAFLAFTIIMSAIISSQDFFFKSIVENGISKKDIIAPKTITVVE